MKVLKTDELITMIDIPAWNQVSFYHAINHKGNWLGTFLDKFGWTKKNLLERDLNLRPPDWRAVFR